MSVYAVFRRHGWGDPEVEWRGPFDSLRIIHSPTDGDPDRTLLVSNDAPSPVDLEVVATQVEPNYWLPYQNDPSYTFGLEITSRKPRGATA
jgi:hypothetical protein